MEQPRFSTGTQDNAKAEVDPRLQPTPDYGTLGPSSDVASPGRGATEASRPRQSARVGPFIAVMVGVFGALVAGSLSSAHPAFPGLQRFFAAQQDQPVQSKDLHQLDRMKPQKQAETLLELAVAQNAGATQQISSHVDGWQGKLHWNSHIANLTTAALNSNDMRVRESGVEVELAAYGLAKNSASLDYLIQTTESPNHEQKIWALWALGLMANRGVAQDRALDVLTAHLKDSDDDSRRWTVEALGLAGLDATIQPLLKMLHDDPSPLVRERAACALAESGMFTPEQRMTAVPQLLIDTDDPALDAQTHAWAFHALNDITHQHLPNDAAMWRQWYETRGNQ